jgi:signal transduction histidine kinase
MLEEEWAGCSQPPGLDYLRRIRESASRLDRLVIDALHYGRIVRQELPATPVDVGRLMRGMIETYPDLQPAAADIAIELNEVVVLGNESLLTQCLGNLLGNAAKFVAPGVRPRIRVWAESRPAPAGSPLSSRGEGSRRDGSPQPSPFTPHTSGTNPFPFMRIWIQDNGIGIPKDAQEKIFRMFQRMHRESDYPGTGIGLAIVRKAAERMGGRVGLESEPGRGSKFWIELPIAAEGESRAFMQDAA